MSSSSTSIAPELLLLRKALYEASLSTPPSTGSSPVPTSKVLRVMRLLWVLGATTTPRVVVKWKPMMVT